jgi:hypothetical protein
MASALGRPPAASAANGNAVLLGQTNDATAPTTVSSTGSDALQARGTTGAGVTGDSVSNYGVLGRSVSGPGVTGVSTTRPGVVGSSVSETGVVGSSQSGLGVRGASDTGGGVRGESPTLGVEGQADDLHGIGVYGHADATTTETYGVYGQTASPLGRGVFGWSQSAAGGTGTWGQADGSGGVGVRGYAWDGGGASGSFGTGVLGSSGSHAFPPPAARRNTGVMGVAPGGTGVYGSGNRGAILAGLAAQLQLAAATAVTHPTVGARGDLFVDKSGRLWFCKGGITWKQLA